MWSHRFAARDWVYRKILVSTVSTWGKMVEYIPQHRILCSLLALFKTLHYLFILAFPRSWTCCGRHSSPMEARLLSCQCRAPGPWTSDLRFQAFQALGLRPFSQPVSKFYCRFCARLSVSFRKKWFVFCLKAKRFHVLDWLHLWRYWILLFVCSRSISHTFFSPSHSPLCTSKEIEKESFPIWRFKL